MVVERLNAATGGSNMAKYRAVIIGCGSIGLQHARAHELERAAGDGRADRAVAARVRVVTGGAVGRVCALAPLDGAVAARLARE
jgi:hypothetical protein